MEQRHTSSPWHVDWRSPNDVRICSSEGPRESICWMANWLPEFQAEVQANARLIAAAPELYEALERLLDHIERIPYRDPANMRLGDTNPFIDRARSALSKARTP